MRKHECRMTNRGPSFAGRRFRAVRPGTLAVCVLALAGLLSAKSYYYPEIRTDVYLNADGSARIIQQRTYAFSGSFSWADVNLKKQGADDIVFNSLEEKTALGWQGIRPQEVTSTAKSLYVKWGYSAEDEEKTFVLDYTVKGAVKRHADVADFYWKVIEDEHARVRTTRTTVTLPAPSPELFKVYVHAAAAPGRLDFNAARNVATIEQGNIPKDAFVEVRVLTRPEIFTRLAAGPDNRYAGILGQEKRNFLVSSLRTFLLLPLGVLLTVIVPLILLLGFFFRYGREPRVEYDAVYEHEPPRAAPPLVVPGILRQNPDKSEIYPALLKGMFATLLDLCRKGIVSVQDATEGRKHRYYFKLEHREKLAAQDQYGRRVADFMFGAVTGNQDTLTEDSLRKWSEKHTTEAQALLGSFYDDARAWWEKELRMPLIDPDSRRAYLRFMLYEWLSIAAGIACLAGGLGRFIGGQPGPIAIAGIVGFVPGVIYTLIGRVINRWQPVAFVEHKRWLSFRRFLQDFSAIRQAPIQLLAIWEQYYVYATVLGVAREFLKHVGRLATERGVPLPLPIWYHAGAGGAASMAGLNAGLAGFESFASNFSGMMNSFSTSAATGGGFSGGGGGGGGGGSSGAG